MEKGPPQARGRALALAVLLPAGCYVFPASSGAEPRRPDYYFVRYDICSVAAPKGEMKALSEPPGRVVRPGRTLFVQAGREAVLRWEGVRVRLRPFTQAEGGTALESREGKVATPPAGGGVLVGLGEVSAFVRVEALE